ncbi:MAG: hypothetical protein P1V18_01885 [Candidatus Gracilibacteria bacterium]|nr:hypothetical protein [Candidatus Gracilibacteria bacterium]
MKNFLRGLLISFSLLILVGCGGSDATETVPDVLDKQLNQILAAKVPFASSKGEAPVLNTHDWDSVFGGESGKDLKYDRYGEIDEVVFVAPPGTLFNLKRQIRKVTRQGDETIYYKVTTPIYDGSQALWIDGRFLNVNDVKPAFDVTAETATKTLVNLRNYENQPYTWRGSSSAGAPELLLYYPPSESISARTQDDWSLKGFNSMGLLYRASNGATPLDAAQLSRFGRPVFKNFNDMVGDDETPVADKKAKALTALLKPLDIVQFGDRVMIVLDNDQITEAKYLSKYAGKVVISNLADTVYGLLDKGEFVEDPFQELVNRTKKKFFIRRYADTSDLEGGEAVEEDTEDTKRSEDAEDTTETDSIVIVDPVIEEVTTESVNGETEVDVNEDFEN